MSRQLSLDTSQRQQVYSFIETPIELNPHRQQLLQAEITDATAARPVAPATPQPGVTRQSTATNVATQELEQARQIHQASNLNSHGPSIHPALSAPYVEESPASVTMDPALTAPQHPPTPYRSPPSSPGPLPVKEHPRPSPIPFSPITPDMNPLQSPLSPSFHTTRQDAQPSNESYSTHLPGQIAHPSQMSKGGGWSTGLCECSSDIGTCCLGFTCPCILYGRTQYRLLRKSRGEDPTNLLGYESCNGSCTAIALLCGCQWILATIQHTRTRRAYEIEGSICSDCVRATCCPCCTCIRNEREIKKREESRAYSAQVHGSNFVVPYIPPGQMQYQPGSR
ncbi:PLAC8 family-domain-containing protein [Talaromyces proteolyticus]|uniref:PLAC8 family-domain-containing protein n=1 Tax=Talaromyces proteolyticus TaxID=1131652 RepID=A0AAD4L0J6_9EURO|nr:PLAC8 family-domain-containing protein [Talaromyces proteolyticus]KAH8705302.1 PLAC8 family-domain-containing protein [Talaromyces proteolyticus]